MSNKLSIIVPVYNVERYIERCLESLVNQTIKDYEIIIIIDGSTDNSINIVKKYKEQYPSLISFYETENKGLSAARNYGLEKALGKYIGFIDSDDYATRDMFEKLYNKAEQGNFDIVACDYYRVSTEGTKEIILGIEEKDSREDKVLKARPYAWNKIYKRSIFNKYNIKFPEGLIFEDICTIYPLLLQVDKIGYVNKKMYYYIYNRPDSIMKSKARDDLVILRVLERLNKICKENSLFDKYKNILCELNVRHIYYRLKEMKNYSNTKLYYLKFTYKSFMLLNKTFPGWKRKSRYIKNLKNKKNKSMLYWQYKIIVKR